MVRLAIRFLTFVTVNVQHPFRAVRVSEAGTGWTLHLNKSQMTKCVSLFPSVLHVWCDVVHVQ